MQKKLFLFEPSIASNNIGDTIIVESCKQYIDACFPKDFLIELPTHTPMSNRYMYFLGKPDYKFICGSNIILGKINTYIHLRQWMINLMTIPNLKDSIFIGVGVQKYHQRMNLYTRSAYKYMFADNWLHSVRDNYTKSALEKIGITNVINTGCPTMWGLTASHCKQINQTKSNNVVFTLTDYRQDKQLDKYLIQTLKRHYAKIFFWPQGIEDYNYFMSLAEYKNVEVLPPRLHSFDKLLERGSIDYIGTRLHGGIRALQKKIRTIIISIDNRANELANDFKLPICNRTELESLPILIDNDWKTDIKIPEDSIALFLKQFKEEP